MNGFIMHLDHLRSPQSNDKYANAYSGIFKLCLLECEDTAWMVVNYHEVNILSGTFVRAGLYYNTWVRLL